MQMLLLRSLIVAALLSVGTVASAGDDVYTNGYFRPNGTYVQPYFRTAPDDIAYNNYSTYPNVNPYTGQVGTRHYPPLTYEPPQHYFKPGVFSVDNTNPVVLGRAAAAIGANEGRAERQRQFEQQRAQDMQCISDEMDRRQRYSEMQTAKAIEERRTELAEQAARQEQAAHAERYFRKADSAPSSEIAENPIPLPSEQRIVSSTTPVTRVGPEVIEAKRNFIRALWPGMQHHVLESDAWVLVRAANDPSVSLADIHRLWVRVDHRTKIREAQRQRQGE